MWKEMSKISHKLDVFHRRYLRTILGMSRRDHVTNDELMKRAGMQDLSNVVKVRRLTLAASGRAYTTVTSRQTGLCGYAVGT